MLMGALILLGGSASAPFIYTLFETSAALPILVTRLRSRRGLPNETGRQPRVQSVRST